jgi:hypothetical protein
MAAGRQPMQFFLSTMPTQSFGNEHMATTDAHQKRPNTEKWKMENGKWKIKSAHRNNLVARLI